MGLGLGNLITAPFDLLKKFTEPGEMKSTTTTQEPWSAQQPYLKNLFQYAQGLYGQPSQSPETLAAMQRMQQRAMSGNNLTTQAQSQFGQTIAGDYLDPNSNPYLAAAVKPALDQAQARVNSTFGGRGGNNFGSSAHADTLARTLSETAMPFYAQNYQQERGNQLNAAQQAPAMAYADLDPLFQVGQMKQQAPWEQLARFQGAVSGNYGGTTTQPYFEQNPYMNLLGLGIAGAGVARGFK